MDSSRLSCYLFITVLILIHNVHGEKVESCVDLSQELFPYCNYNRSMYPSLLNHRKQEEASVEMKIFEPLIKVACSPELEIYLCALYAPSCVNIGPIPPCRELCEKAKDGCAELMNRFGFPWPEYLRCDQWQNRRADVICIHHDDIADRKFECNGGNARTWRWF